VYQPSSCSSYVAFSKSNTFDRLFTTFVALQINTICSGVSRADLAGKFPLIALYSQLLALQNLEAWIGHTCPDTPVAKSI
jgi:hypothetical protein